MTKQKKEHKEIVRHSCGHTIEYKTYGYKLERRQVKSMQTHNCGKCQLQLLLAVSLKRNETGSAV